MQISKTFFHTSASSNVDKQLNEFLGANPEYEVVTTNYIYGHSKYYKEILFVVFNVREG